MPFAAALRKSLQERGSEVPAEFKRGDSLEDVLNRHLRTVEQMGGDDVFTCILLLSPDGKRLSVGAAPTVPASYCRAGDSFEIGLSSVDIETDPIWADFRDVALRHGFRSCWSTPIRNSNGAIIGTFAILHQTVGMPTDDEIDAIELITEHVANAIMWFRGPQFFARPDQRQSTAPLLKLVSNNQEARDPAARLVALVEKLHSQAADLDRYAGRSVSETDSRNLREAAELSRELAANIMTLATLVRSEEPGR